MKKLFLVFALSFAYLFSLATPKETEYTTPLEETSDSSDSDHKERNDKGNRSRHRKYECHISSEKGISIKGIDRNLIWSYELWTEDEESLFATGDEFSFIEMINSYPEGTYIILFRTDSHIYYGYIDL